MSVLAKPQSPLIKNAARVAAMNHAIRTASVLLLNIKPLYHKTERFHRRMNGKEGLESLFAANRVYEIEEMWSKKAD